MKNLLLILVLSVFCNLLSIGQVKTLPKDEYSIKLPEGYVHFELDTCKVLIKFNEGLSEYLIDNYLKYKQNLAEYDSIWYLTSPKVTIVQVKKNKVTLTYTEMIKSIQKNPMIEYTAPVLKYKSKDQWTLYNMFFVKLKNDKDINVLKHYANKLKFIIDKEWDKNIFLCLVNKKSKGNTFELAKYLQSLSLFEFVEPDFIYTNRIETNDPYFTSQWALNNTGQFNGTYGDDIDIVNAWTISTGSSSIKVAILDCFGSLAQFNHPDITFYSEHDATGTGFIANGYPGEGHGISCAGIIKATGNNSLGLAGVAYNCNVIAVKIGTINSASGSWYATGNSISDGITWAYQNADVISNSNSLSWSSLIDAAIANAITLGRNGKGTPFFSSAGNNNSTTIGYPASNSNTIAVGASSMCDQRKSPTSCDGETWWGSDYGNGLDIAAPGVHIYTTDISGSAGYTSGDYNEFFNGTSAACPMAAGTMALILSVNPNLTASQARNILESTCEKVGGYTYNSGVSGQPNGTWSTQMGYGRINAFLALQAVTCNPPSAPILTFGGSSCPGTAGTNIFPPGTTLSWNIVSGATGYKIYVSKYPYGSSCLLTGYNPFPCSNYQGYIVMSAALEPGMLYRWNMNATSDCSNSNCDSPMSGTNYFYVPPSITPSTSQIICQGQSVTFSTTPANVCSGGSVTYQWYKNGAIISGATNTTYNATQSGTYYIQFNFSGSSYCSSASIQSTSVTVTVNPTPGTASVSGATSPCLNSTQNYLATATNATAYNWTCPAGWTINSGQGTSSINVTVGTSSGQVCATPSNSCGNGTQGCQSVTVNPTPGTASVSGSSSPCQNSTQNYTATATNATTYNWTCPAGWTINSGQGTSSINVTVGTSSGQVCATPSNSCGNGTQGCQSVTVNPTPGTASVSGSSSPCQNSTQNYTATATNATAYNWTCPAGWTINSGQGTSSINVTVGTSSGQVCATPSNSCGNGTQGCQSITVNPTPGTANVSGATSPCQNSTQTYTANATNATTYTWTCPAGWTINSGQGTSSINVTVGTSSGQVCATPSNSCGNGTQGCQSITVNPIPGTANVSGATSPCQNSTQTYTANATNATAYTWTCPAGWTINSGQGTSSINVTIGTSSGQVCATPSNSCGNGTQGCQSVTVNQTPGTASVSGSSSPCQNSIQNYTATATNATAYNWTCPAGWTINSGQGTSSINVTVGTSSGQVCATPSNSCGNGTQGCQSITVNPTPGNASVSGSSSPCQNSTQTYTATATNATAYNWTCPAGWTINSGQGTSSINVTVGTSSGQVCATPSNSCGNGTQGCQSITVNPTPGTANVSGATSPCQNSTQNYTATATNATAFNWTCPAGWTINSGQGTSLINVTTGTASGQVCATPSNSCGNGTQGCQLVTATQIPDTSVTVNGNTLISNANGVSYQWLRCPSLQIINGATYKSYTATQNGNYSVQVTNNGCTDTSNCHYIGSVGILLWSNLNNISVYPNPTDELINIKGDDLFDGNFEIILSNTLGQPIIKQSVNVINHAFITNIRIKDLSSGTYFLIIRSERINKVIKVQKL